jgi:hypothetical protein
MKQGSLRPARKELEDLIPYDAKEVKTDMRLAANESPLNMPEELKERIANHLGQFQFNRYPDATAPRLRALIAEANGLDPDNVLIGNGGDELLMNMFLTWGGVGRKFMDFPPTFSMYENYAKITGTEVVSIPRDENFEIDQEATRNSGKPQQPFGESDRRSVPPRTSGLHRCARLHRRGILRVLAHHGTPLSRQVSQPGDPADLLESVFACRIACRVYLGRYAGDQGVSQGASTVFGERFLPMGGAGRIS